MRPTARSGLIKSLAIVLAMVGAMLFGAPQGAQAAPAIVSSEVAGPAATITDVQYGGHWRHHGRGFRHHHHHGRHFGHRHHRHFGHHYGRRHGHHYGHRRYRY
ncbi:hypothetical protein ASF49_06505 [Methylobacterium sp. Leaf104]|uniref:hypothetical protein n=1 Tax=Methylobacterium TaxID=407 RepID=UPI0006FFADD7|nr:MULTISPECIES: hypothetical protein [Methylobacterium]KQP33544.1 hypothetical protein ASF49_06505 [Methylobacterium sp. Leaf104]MCI9879933.1 hypothetical protein [Methylobacterium goesingense]